MTEKENFRRAPKLSSLELYISVSATRVRLTALESWLSFFFFPKQLHNCVLSESCSAGYRPHQAYLYGTNKLVRSGVVALGPGFALRVNVRSKVVLSERNDRKRELPLGPQIELTGAVQFGIGYKVASYSPR